MIKKSINKTIINSDERTIIKRKTAGKTKKTFTKKKTAKNKKQRRKNKIIMPEESLAVGGQAIIEGVMMRNGDTIATAVRLPNNKIKVKKDYFKSLTKKIRILGWPFIRGAVNLVEILIIGMKIMIYSSNQQLDDDEDLTMKELFFTILFSIIFSIVIFKLIPLLIATLFQKKLLLGNITFNLIDGFVKTAILVAYLWIIGFMPDVKRLFQYHGAEHKTINCFEKNIPLTPKNVIKQTRFHPRCGTTFILIVFLVSILFYLVIPLETSFAGKLLLRVLLLPLIGGVSYEIIKFGGKHYDNPVMKIILYPGMLLQRLTTREPDEEQAEVAIKSLKAAINEI